MNNTVISRQSAAVATVYVAVVVILCGGLVGCDRDGAIESTMSVLKLSSQSFKDGAAIPKGHTGDGADVSPELNWKGVPSGTAEFALIVDDPDAPRPQPWVHWVVYGIGAECRSLGEGAVISDSNADGTPITGPRPHEGLNSWKTVGYRGPKPPTGDGVHHYNFTLYALDTSLGLGDQGVTKAQLLEALAGHVLAEAKLIGTYER